MFRIGGSAGTGITSGLDQPQKMAKGGRIGYANGTMPTFQATGLPGFLTQFGLNLLSTPPQGNIFATAATAARDPFNLLQASQVESMKTASDRKFARELAAEEREFEEGQLEKKLAAQKEIVGMDTKDTTERIQAIADTKYDGDEIRATREVNFATETYPTLTAEYGQESVATSVIDSSSLQKPRDIEKFVNLNPQLARQVVYDVRTGKAMRFVKDQTGKYALVPADSSDMDRTGEGMPDPNITPGLFGQKVDEQKVKEFKERISKPDFGIGFYE